MNKAASLGHRSLNSNEGSYFSERSNFRAEYVPPEMVMAPMQFGSRVCSHSPTLELPCARRIIKTLREGDAVTHQWVSCKGTRFVSTTIPLLHGQTAEKIAQDAALFGHTREENKKLRETQRPERPVHTRSETSGQTDSSTESWALPTALQKAHLRAPSSAGSSPGPSSGSSLR